MLSRLSVKQFILPFFAVTVLCFSACTKKTARKNPASLKLEIKKVPDDNKISGRRIWRPADKEICILFGYGYNDKKFIQTILSSLEKEYGLKKDGGALLPLIYPDDFNYGGSVRISILANLLENENIGGLITLGAPEYTYKALAAIQDSWGGKIPFPVFSLFPQDEVLGIEAGSDFVLEHSQLSGKMDLTEEEQVMVASDDVPAIIESCVHYLTLLHKPLPQNDQLHAIVQKIVGSDKPISRYVDPETGLQAINHFVLKK
ncbi:MAG: hypothetical protein LKF96_07455 [Treponema sp.]|jgi:hypothetical protein|nr:hypothetical protein [Treponema sp.]